MGPLAETALAVLRQFLLFEALLLPLEAMRPTRHDAPAPRRAVDVLHFALDPFLINAGSAALLALLSTALGVLVPTSVSAALRAQSWGLQLLEIFLLAEVGAYWAHRAAHAWEPLWRLHAVHHSSERLTWLSAHRQHPLETVWMLGVTNLPVLVLGFDLETAMGLILAQKLYTAFLHADIKLAYGRAARLFASPHFHHWHHQDEGRRPANFSAALSLLDVAFGTYDEPAERLPLRYGAGEPVSRSWIGQLLLSRTR